MLFNLRYESLKDIDFIIQKAKAYFMSKFY